MAAIIIEFDSAPILDKLARLQRALAPEGYAGVLGEIGEYLAESTRQRFVTSTAPDGSKWAPNAKATYLGILRRDSKEGGKNTRKDGRINTRGTRMMAGKKPLVDSGDLATYIEWQRTADGSGVDIGTNRFADEWTGGAAVHQFGSRDGRIPARPFLGLSAADERKVESILDHWLLQALGA